MVCIREEVEQTFFQKKDREATAGTVPSKPTAAFR